MQGKWGGELAGRVKRVHDNQFDSGNMKNRVNSTKNWGKLEPDGHRIDHLGDAVWTNKLGCQLTKRHTERQVFGGESNPLATHMGWRRGPAVIGSCFGFLRGED